MHRKQKNIKQLTSFVMAKMKNTMFVSVCPVIATQNIKEKEITHKMEFVIQDTDDDEFQIKDECFDMPEFSNNFLPSFCVTVYKYQGAKIHEQYNIYEVNRMDKKQLYKAMSRTKKFKYIHNNQKDLNHKYLNRQQPVLELTNSKFNSLLKEGKIY